MLTTSTKWNSSWGMRHSRATGQPAYAIKDFTSGRMETIAELTNSAETRPSLCRGSYQARIGFLPAARVGGRLAMFVPSIPLVRVQHVPCRVFSSPSDCSESQAQTSPSIAKTRQDLSPYVFDRPGAKNCAGNDNAARTYISSNLGSNRCIHGAPSTE